VNLDATWYGGRPRLRRHCIRWGPPKGHSPRFQFSVHVCSGQTAGWIKMPLGRKVDVGPGDIVSDGTQLPQMGSVPQFSAHICCRQTARWKKMPLGTEVGLGQGGIVSDGDASVPSKGYSTSNFSDRVYYDQTAGWINIPLGRPRPKPHCVRWGAAPAPSERGTAAPPLFGPCILWPNGRPSQLLLSSCVAYNVEHRHK